MKRKKEKPAGDLIDALEPHIEMTWLQKLVARTILSQLFKKIETMKSWKTTLLGIAALLVALGSGLVALFDGDPATVINIDEIIAALAGLGLLAARDNKVTSEEAGAK